MKKLITYLVLFLSSLIMVSCTSNQPKTKKMSSENKSSTQLSSKSQEESSDTLSSSSQSSQSETEDGKDKSSFNGNYYSVQGKFGEVIIVNKKHPLAKNYNPGENPEASAAFQNLLSAMRQNNLTVSNDYSGFRSYETQDGLYNSYVASDGKANADRYSARPGYSEHQTGLAFDIKDSSGNLLEEPNAVKWLAENADRFGFIVRYPAEKESITGYMPETWHVRYIGKEATDIYQSGLSLEEYYDVSGGTY